MTIGITRDVSPEERIKDAAERRRANPSDNVVWLETERDILAAMRDRYFAKDDKIMANDCADRAVHLYEAAGELAKLRDQVATLRDIVVNRVIDATKRK